MNPGRFRDRKEPKSKPLGNPSGHLDATERKAWFAFRRELPWLTEADRCLVELACHLRARAWRGALPAAAVPQLRMCLSAMGATPTDRSKVAIPPDDAGDDPAEKFFFN